MELTNPLMVISPKSTKRHLAVTSLEVMAVDATDS